VSLFIDTETAEMIGSLVREARDLRDQLRQRQLDLSNAATELQHTSERHDEVHAKLKSILALAGRQRMPSARPRASKGKARK
jgi:hypothetical protein